MAFVKKTDKEKIANKKSVVKKETIKSENVAPVDVSETLLVVSELIVLEPKIDIIALPEIVPFSIDGESLTHEIVSLPVVGHVVVVPTQIVQAVDWNLVVDKIQRNAFVPLTRRESEVIASTIRDRGSSTIHEHNWFLTWKEREAVRKSLYSIIGDF